jgi:hypothetical protein
MNSGEWRVLGFDGRMGFEQHLTSPMPLDVRREMLLRTEIGSPFSIDRHVWPTVFQYYPRILQAAGLSDPQLIRTDADCTGGLWLNLAKMKSRLSESERTAAVIAIELFAFADESLDEFVGLIDFSPEPTVLPDCSFCLGYDIADSGMISGLSDCGFSQAERSSLQTEWAPHINDFGLLASGERALDFKVITDKRVPEHAPFWVYRISLLP